MDSITIDATPRSPRVSFDFAQGRFVLEGESYPEDAAAFFGPLIQALKGYLDQGSDVAIVFDLIMAYFNSSSAKALMNLFQLLEEAAGAGRSVTINWHFHPDDDTMEEFGEDFAQDFSSATFNLSPIPEGLSPAQP